MVTYKRIQFTERDRKILQCIVEARRKRLKNVYGYVAQKLLLDPNTVRNRMYRLRKKYEACLAFMQEYREWRRKLGFGRQFI
jgi:hypothetical protein